MKTVVLFLVVALLHTRQHMAAAQLVPFTLINSRPIRSNIITLRCRNSDDIFDPQAKYFINGTRLDSFSGFEDTSQDSIMVVFQITRRLEGEYSCGTELQRSESLSFVAFPDSNVIPPREPVYFLVGETARLQCGIQPGALAGQYFARWLNGTSERILYNYPSPSLRLVDPSQEMSDSPRYTIDPSDLSLMIGNVQRSDSLGSYRCEVGVEDPLSPNQMTYDYESTTRYNISLEVVAPPRIVKDFPPSTVIVEGENMTFKCIAQGYPAPTISWQHAGRAVVNGDSPHFTVNSTERNDGFLVTVTGYLNLSSADDSVNGEVRCITHPPTPDMVGGMALDNDYTSTQLSVLGTFNDLEIEITTKGDVIIIVNLQQALPVPVHLVLVYRDLENSFTPPDMKITRAAYLNTSVIRHIDFASQVPFEHFTVEVGLFSQHVRGQLFRAQGEYDQDKPTLFDNTIPTSILIVTGVVPAVILLIVAVTIVMIIGFIYREKHRHHKLQYKTQVSDNEHKEQKQQNELNHKVNEHQLELNKEVQIHELNLKHDERKHQQELDHAHKLECLNIFKGILEDLVAHLRANNTKENVKELLKFLNKNIVPLLDPSKRRTDGEDETDFGGVPSPNSTVANVALDADEHEIKKLLGTFIESLQQQHTGSPI